MMRGRLPNLFFVGIAWLSLSACLPGSAPETHKVSAFSGGTVCRIAVLPFLNESREKEAGDLMYRIFLNELTAAGIGEVVSEGDVRQFMVLFRQLPQDFHATSSPIMAQLMEHFDVDAIVRGRIAEYGTESAGQDANIPYVALQVEMVSAKDGARLLSTFHRRGGNDYRKALHFGVVRTKTGLFAKVSKEVIDNWRVKGEFSCP
ncbi:hypothetical protein [Desulfuromonas sp. AOP6]|uniref:hypothetical protein n=1 Tax=Desulfuromonas sp. AOP6 TaxID=1566351 RepID=UPI0012872CB5|nr:hypothetical protein [Desulfuromonas sp. AOP6]BCA79349.1 hypothetical protein AOP6_1136 [Desulfuromonas sp. AOP6]